MTDAVTLLREIGIRMREDLIKSRRTHIVCGPISSGGLGSVKQNLKLFNAVIGMLSAGGYPIWSQMPYEDEIQVAKEVWLREHPGETYCSPILDFCYEPLFKLRRFEVAHFIPKRGNGPGESRGAQWEYDKLISLGVECRDIDQGLVDLLLEDLFPEEVAVPA